MHRVISSILALLTFWLHCVDYAVCEPKTDYPCAASASSIFQCALHIYSIIVYIPLIKLLFVFGWTIM
jgi:hypothetical protein